MEREFKPSAPLTIAAYLLLMFSSIAFGAYSTVHFGTLTALVVITIHVLAMAWFGGRVLYWIAQFGPKEQK